MEKHAHAAAINRIGKAKLRSHFNLSRQGIHNWTVTGIPTRYHASVRLLAQLNGVVVPEVPEQLPA